MRISLPGASRLFLNYVAMAAVVITAGQTGCLENARCTVEAGPVLMAVKSDNRIIESNGVNNVLRKDRFPAGPAKFWKLWIPQLLRTPPLRVMEGSPKSHASA
jgi:hypothetical protein